MRARAACWAMALSGLAATARAAESWIELKTADFTVVTNAGEGTGRGTATEFEQVRAAFTKVLPGMHLAEARPTMVLAFRDESTLRKWAPGYFVKGGINVVSGSVGGADWEYLLLRTDARPSNVQVTPNYNVYRAYVSLLLSDSFERRLPAWLEVGLSYVLGNTSVADKDIEIGRPVPWEFSHFNTHSRFPLRSVLDARYASPLLKQEDQRETFDAQSYVLVHYLLFADGGAHEPQFNRFLELWQSGRGQDQAIAEVFGNLKTLEDALPGYATRSVLSFARLKTEAKIAAERPPSRALSAAEVAGLRASVHVAMGRPDDAQAAIREARSADERSPVSYDAEGLLADHDKDRTRAKAAYDQAVELVSTSAHTYYRSAQLAWKPEPDAATLALQRERLERAIALNGAYVQAHAYLAEVLAAQGEGQAALESAKRAVALRPSAYYPRLALARALDALGRADDARKAAEVALRVARDEDERSHVEQFLSHLKQNAAYAAQRTRMEASQQSTACSGGDAAACAAVRPAIEEACDRKEAKACAFLSWMHGGHGLPKDDAKAADYLGRACDAGDRDACVQQAWALAKGEGVTKDEPRGIASLDALCTGGYLPACTRLALVYVGKAAPSDRARAKPLLARSCDGGEQEACSLARQLK